MKRLRWKILTVLGTRPEAIKLAPVIHEIDRHPNLISRVCVTGQHREMLDPLLKLFSIHPDHDLDIMQPGQNLPDLTARLLLSLTDVLEREQPAFVLVQGDTTTAMVGALAAFYAKISVGHVEAGLRTGDKYAPFPEEMNRRLISQLADVHFAPTERARDNLLKEGINPEAIYVTGNTVVDALTMVLERTKGQDHFNHLLCESSRKLVLVTAHRRESFGQPLENICLALREIAQRQEDVQIIYPVHLNPNVRATVETILRGVPRVHLVEPLDYVTFVHLMSRAHVILTDSGGIQEEAPSLGKPVLVMRESTERPEAIEAGMAKLVGTDPQRIVTEVLRLLNDPGASSSLVLRQNPFGDGHAAERIVAILCKILHDAGR